MPIHLKKPGSTKMRGGVPRLCVGCGSQIHDQYILRVAPNLEWHAACLKCCECQKFLDENCTCFVREGKIFCKDDYLRLYGTKCEKCKRSFGKNDFVMRAKSKIFHLECFRCVACGKQLVPGDEFALRNDGLYCKEDHQFSVAAADEVIIKREENNNEQMNDDPNNDDDDLDYDLDDDDLKSEQGESRSDRMSEQGMDELRGRKSNIDSKNSSSGSETSSSSHNHQQQPQQHQQQRRSRAGRVRTVLTEKQLQLLKSCYMANPRPDALMKEQLVEMTGLSPRVIRVWFQNKRCKDKKKMQMKQNKEVRKMGYGNMQGIPMMASSPLRHDMSVLPHHHQNSVDIQSYEPPWKALCDFALNSDLDRLNPNIQHYQNVVNQMHGCYDYRPPGDPSMIYSQPIDNDNILMGGMGRSIPEDEPPLGDLDSTGYTLTSLDSIANSMDRIRSTKV